MHSRSLERLRLCNVDAHSLTDESLEDRVTLCTENRLSLNSVCLELAQDHDKLMDPGPQLLGLSLSSVGGTFLPLLGRCSLTRFWSIVPGTDQDGSDDVDATTKAW